MTPSCVLLTTAVTVRVHAWEHPSLVPMIQVSAEQIEAATGRHLVTLRIRRLPQHAVTVIPAPTVMFATVWVVVQVLSIPHVLGVFWTVIVMIKMLVQMTRAWQTSAHTPTTPVGATMAMTAHTRMPATAQEVVLEYRLPVPATHPLVERHAPAMEAALALLPFRVAE